MSALSWVLFAACNIASGALGWLIHSAIVEHREFCAEERRDREWDEQHGVCHG